MGKKSFLQVIQPEPNKGIGSNILLIDRLAVIDFNKIFIVTSWKKSFQRIGKNILLILDWKNVISF